MVSLSMVFHGIMFGRPLLWGPCLVSTNESKKSHAGKYVVDSQNSQCQNNQPSYCGYLWTKNQEKNHCNFSGYLGWPFEPFLYSNSFDDFSCSGYVAFASLQFYFCVVAMWLFNCSEILCFVCFISACFAWWLMTSHDLWPSCVFVNAWIIS